MSDTSTTSYYQNCNEFMKRAKSRPYTIALYHALQAAISHQRKHIADAAELADDLVPTAQHTPRAGVSMGQLDFNLLNIVFDIEHIPESDRKDITFTDSSDRKQYCFTRKNKGGSTTAVVKVDTTVNTTTLNPDSTKRQARIRGVKV